jgi:hypothetical protein
MTAVSGILFVRPERKAVSSLGRRRGQRSLTKKDHSSGDLAASRRTATSGVQDQFTTRTLRQTGWSERFFPLDVQHGAAAHPTRVAGERRHDFIRGNQ